MKGPAHEKNAEQLQYNGFRFLYDYSVIFEKNKYTCTLYNVSVIDGISLYANLLVLKLKYSR